MLTKDRVKAMQHDKSGCCRVTTEALVALRPAQAARKLLFCRRHLARNWLCWRILRDDEPVLGDQIELPDPLPSPFINFANRHFGTFIRSDCISALLSLGAAHLLIGIECKWHKYTRTVTHIVWNANTRIDYKHKCVCEFPFYLKDKIWLDRFAAQCPAHEQRSRSTMSTCNRIQASSRLLLFVSFRRSYLEYRLHLAERFWCECNQYFISLRFTLNSIFFSINLIHRIGLGNLSAPKIWTIVTH